MLAVDLRKERVQQASEVVAQAVEAEETVDLVAKHLPDVLLLDITMPGMSGEETLAALKRLKADVRVLLTSGHGEQEVVGKFGRAGLAGFVQKPFRAEELAHRIEDILSRG